MTPLIRVVLVDDHPVVRRGLAAIIDIEDDLQVVGEAENGREALALTQSVQPDVVLMDLQMPVMDGVEATQRICALPLNTQVIVLTTFGDDDYIDRGLAAGARGYLLKDAPPDHLIEAIRAAHRGEALLDPGVAARLLDRFSTLASPGASPPPRPAKLTSREQEVLALMARGARNKEIAHRLVISERTVKIHVSSILGKLNVTNRTEAVTVALKTGLL
ncbi:MAG: response regulator [Anaerolineae bacterium]